jgi:hypothetical protein
MKINLASFKGIALVYVAIAIIACVYFVGLQHFGYNGFNFVIEGKDRIVSPLDVVIILTFVISVVLLLISLAAFGRKKTVRIFIISMAFFFFTVKEFLILLENFFPRENIYTGNAAGALEFLILLSFVLLIYNIYRPKR